MRRRALAAALISGAALLSVPTSVAAAPVPAAPGAVTLITGDQVELSPTGAPRIIPAAGREGVHYRITRDDEHLNVVPLDAMPLLAAGRLDPRLFDVNALVDAGYTADLGLIVRRDPAARAATPALREKRALPAVRASAAQVSKADTQELWKSLVAGNSGLTEVWLNGRRDLTLEHSVPQIGAPAAWQSGYTGTGTTVAVLDSGIDATHPDLAGRVTERANFTTAPDGDQVGHGTHVSSIVAAVAPDTTLLDGKVCEQRTCFDDAILAGMAWAATRAPVVNMSLSAPDTEGTDPVEAAVDELSATHGTLFVTSAGNFGTAFLGSPASADAALAVGAVDRADAVAGFSSRGPRTGDHAIKPDLAAPGVEIVAAQAAGTEAGTPTGDGHTALSGTSMAAPHVAGVAALLRQRHPDWTREQLKSGLMGSAAPAGAVFETGAGRVDAARAVTQDVTASPASVSFGLVQWPHEDDAVSSQQITYRNDGPADVLLDVAVPAPFTVSPATVTVPAGGTAAVTVTVDTRSAAVPIGTHTGHVVATGAGVSVRTPVAVEKEDERYAVNLTHIDREGDTPAIHLTTFDKTGDCTGDAEECSPYTVGDGPTSTLRLPPGEYIVTDTSSTDGQDTAILTHPKLVVEADVALTLDARATKPVDVRAPRGEAANVRLTMGYDADDPDRVVAFIFNTGWELPPLYVGQVPGSPPAGGRVHSLVNAKFGEPGPAGDFTDTPYVYNLASAKDGIYDGVRLVPSPREFAKVETTYATPSAAPRGATLDHMATSRTAPDWFFDPPFFLRFLRLSRLPQHVTEYYLADGVRWSTMVEHYNEDYTSPLRQEDSVAGRVYQAGRIYRVDWGKGVLGPAFDEPRLYPLGPQGVGRTGDEFLAGISSASDATHFSGPHLPTGAGRLLRDGQVVAEWPEAGYMVTTLPPAAATYQLEHTARTGVDVSTEISSRWTFRSGHTTSPTPLPLMAVRFTPTLDDHNHAAAGRFTIPVSVQRQPGAIPSIVDSLAVEVSYDDGTTWRSAPVVGGKVVVDNPAGGAVSLRAKAVDRAGNKVEQTIMRAYLVR